MSRLSPCPHFYCCVALAGTSLALAAIPAYAATVAWNGASGADWDTGTNWTGLAKPATADTALFNLTGITSVTNATADQTVTGISFDTAIASTGAFTLGTTVGNKLILQNGGTIQILSSLTGTGKTVTVNAPLVLAGTSYSFSNANTDASNTLNFGGGITSTSGTTILTLNGANTGNNAISGNITNGPSGTMGVSKSGAGTWILSGAANTYSGNTAISAGTLTVSGALTTAGNISVNGATTPVLNITGSLTRTGGGGPRTFQVGATAGTSATVNVSGSGILNLGGGMMLGENKGGNGTMNVTGGTVTNSAETWFSGANSLLNVSGGIFNANGTTRIGGGNGATSNSTLTVSGSGSYIGSLNFGIGGNGATSTVNIGDGSIGGSLTLTGMSVSGGVNTVNFNGGTLVANATINTPAAVPVAGATFETVVKSGGANISVLGANTLTIATGLTNGGGGGGLTKSGTGTLTLNGTNTYTGTTTLNQGTLTVGTTGTLAATTAALSVNNNNTTAAGTAAILNLSTAANTTTGSLSGSISTPTSGTNTATINTQTSRTFTVNQTADGTYAGVIAGAGNFALGSLSTNTLTLSGNNTYTGATTISGGKLLFSRGASNTNDYSGTGAYSIASGATLEINGTANARFNTSNNQFTGAGTFIKSGSGRTFLTAGSNTQSFNMSAGGLIDVQGGILDTSAQATNLASLNIASGAQFFIAHTDSITTLQFDALTGGGTLRMVAAATRTVALGANGGSGTFSGVIGNVGTINLTKTGAGTQILSGANTYVGGTSINEGTLQFAKLVSMPVSGVVAVGTGATLAVNVGGTGEWTTGTSGNGTIGGLLAGLGGQSGGTVNYTGAVTLGLDTSNAAGTQTYSGAFANVGTTLGLTKLGTGTLALAGASTYTGTTTISGGSVILGSGTGTTGTGAVTVQSGGTILGSGVVQGSSFTAESGSAVQAGDSTALSSYGTLNFTPVSGSGAFDFQSGSSVILGINPGGTSDLLNFTGTGTSTLLFNGDLTVGPAGFTPTASEVFNLLDWSGLASAPTFASRYTYAGLLTGNGDEAAGLDLPDISGSGFFWDISQFTTSGSIAIVVPEPSRALLLLAGLFGWLARRRRR